MSSYAPGSRLAIVSACPIRGGDFSVRNQKLRLPLDDNSSRFGSVSERTHRQALAGLSWLSFSRPGVSPGTRVRPAPGSGPRGPGGSPRRPALNEPHESFTRSAFSRKALVRTPREDSRDQCRAHLLQLSRPRTHDLRARGLSRSPCFKLERTAWDRMLGLDSWGDCFAVRTCRDSFLSRLTGTGSH